MVDIHHHLLWGVDDGAKDFATSLAMAKACAQDGVTHVVCTPHANGQFNYDPDGNKLKVAELQERLKADDVPLSVGLGCDFHLSYDNVMEAKVSPTKFSVNGLGYLMVEIPDYGVPSGLTETFYELQLAGLTPILTHPERNPTLQQDYSRLGEWMRGGVLVQVTGDSVTGKMGRKAEKLAHLLLRQRWVHFIASDAHNLSSRPPRLSEAKALIAKKYGESYAEALLETNPMAVFEGKALAAIDEPQGLYEDVREKSWWQRLLD